MHKRHTKTTVLHRIRRVQSYLLWITKFNYLFFPYSCICQNALTFNKMTRLQCYFLILHIWFLSPDSPLEDYFPLLRWVSFNLHWFPSESDEPAQLKVGVIYIQNKGCISLLWAVKEGKLMALQKFRARQNAKQAKINVTALSSTCPE